MRRLPPMAAVRAFEAAARTENFTAAAAELGMTQAAVSYQVKSLEERLGAPLFVREKGRARLTPLGARLLPEALLGPVQRELARVHKQRVRPLKISNPPRCQDTKLPVHDQWRQVGLNVKPVTLESAAWLQAQKNGDFEVSTNAPCNSIVEPDMDLHWFLTTSPVNFSRHKDTVMDDLYSRQSRATDPEERRKILRAFEKRLYDDEVHYIMTFQWNRIVPHLSKVRGWTITPSHFLNCQLDGVWLAE